MSAVKKGAAQANGEAVQADVADIYDPLEAAQLIVDISMGNRWSDQGEGLAAICRTVGSPTAQTSLESALLHFCDRMESEVVTAILTTEHDLSPAFGTARLILSENKKAPKPQAILAILDAAEQSAQLRRRRAPADAAADVAAALGLGETANPNASDQQKLLSHTLATFARNPLDPAALFRTAKPVWKSVIGSSLWKQFASSTSLPDNNRPGPLICIGVHSECADSTFAKFSETYGGDGIVAEREVLFEEEVGEPNAQNAYRFILAPFKHPISSCWCLVEGTHTDSSGDEDDASIWANIWFGTPEKLALQARRLEVEHRLEQFNCRMTNADVEITEAIVAANEITKSASEGGFVDADLSKRFARSLDRMREMTERLQSAAQTIEIAMTDATAPKQSVPACKGVRP